MKWKLPHQVFLVTALCICFWANGQSINLTITGTSFCRWDSAAGTLTVNATGGQTPYTYAWSNGATTQTITQLQPNTYCVTVTDGNGLSAIGCDSVVRVAKATVSVLPENCSSADGKAWVNITGGTPPFDVIWSNTATGDTVYNLSEGYYSVRVFDSAGCQATGNNWWDDSIGFTINRTLPYTYTLTTQPHNCPQLGSAAVHVTGGTAPITYTWSTNPPQYADSLGGLYGGSYRVTISDATLGCSVVETVFITNTNPLTVSQTTTPEFCNFSNGTATVIPQTGTAPYTYAWNTTPVQTTITATGLNSGAIQVTVADANNCSRTLNVQVPNQSPIQPNLVKTDEVCNNQAGKVRANPSLGTAPYTFQWSTGATTDSITNLNNGVYAVTISDTQGCTVAAATSVSDVAPFTATTTFTNTQCNVNTGRITVSVSGTTGPYTYLWNTTPPQTTDSITGLGVGSYRCTVTDANGCTASVSRNIGFAATVGGYVSTTSAVCITATGSATVTANSGLPPYTYVWNNSQNTTTITGLVKGWYYVTITDANGCKTVKNGFVQSSSPIGLSVSRTNASCIYTNDGSAIAVASNAVSPVTYHWSNGQNTPNATGLAQGWSYRVAVTDANGCSATASTGNIGYQSIACAVQASGKVVKDMDKNCAFTTGDEGIPGSNVKAIPGYYDITDAQGNYSFVVPAGSYALTHTFPYHTFPLCPVGPITLLNQTAGTVSVNNNFYDTVRAALDLSVGFGYLSPPRPGFNHTARINYANLGNIWVTAQVEYTYDADVTFVSASGGTGYIHDQANRKVIFTINTIVPNVSGYLSITFSTGPTVALGTPVTDCVQITPIQNDVNFTNNSMCRTDQVVGAYDPNDKAVTPQGLTAAGLITRNDTVLEYRIRFQNTGTYYAKDVVILDTLDADVDPGTVSDIYSSHPVKADFFQNKILAFYFNNINLPDSNTNEPGSHGFVYFKIKVRPNLPHGTEIKNKVAIYFDYNEPIITNEVLNTINDPVGIAKLPQAKVGVYPNPSTGEVNMVVEHAAEEKVIVTVNNLLGQTMLSKPVVLTAGNNQIPLSLGHLPQGVYLLNINSESKKYGTVRVIVQY